MTRSGVSCIGALVAILFTVVLAPAARLGHDLGRSGTGSNVCTVASPNCNTIAQAVTASASGDAICASGRAAFRSPRRSRFQDADDLGRGHR